jgi:curli biogenesis system outer membrane secretion channel CsgG
MSRLLFTIFSVFFLASCASTTSVIPAAQTAAGALLVVMPLEGEYGTQASDMLAQQLLQEGYRVVERSRIEQVLRELGYSRDFRFDASSLPKIGNHLGVHYIIVGSNTTMGVQRQLEMGGPLYSFDHVNMNLRLVSVSSGEILWAARYGNPMWTSAVSTQGDIQRGAKDLISEFQRTYSARLQCK